MPETAAAPGGPRVLLTGATGGIGRAISRRLAADGAALALAGRDPRVLGGLAGALGAVALPGDLRDPGAPEKLVAEAVEKLGGLDAVVLNAGIGWSGPLVEMPLERMQALVEVNLTAPLRIARAALPHLASARWPGDGGWPSSARRLRSAGRSGGARRSPGSHGGAGPRLGASGRHGGGRLVVVGSIAGHLGVREEAVYSATKAALRAAAEAIAQEHFGRVAVALVSPGAVATQFFARRGRPYDRRLPRVIPPEKVAATVARALAGQGPELVVPRWLVVPSVLRAVAPGTYRQVAARLG